MNIQILNQLLDKEKQFLDALLSLTLYPHANKEEEDENYKVGEKLPFTITYIRKRGQLLQELPINTDMKLDEWINASKNLLRKGLIELKSLNYNLTDLGKSSANQVRLNRIGNRFSDTMIRMERSKTFSIFCERVFGKDLCQANMMDMTQLDKLLEVLNLTSDNRVLDLGCGIGKIAEYISDTTNAYVLGIDIASKAIKQAQERTTKKQNRLEFQVGDINDLSSIQDNFDTIIAIATLHYMANLENSIGQMKTLVSPKGQMGLFTFQYRTINDSPDILLPENTKLGQALKKYGLTFQTWEYTQREIEIWYRQLDIAKELKEEFQREGNLDLCEDRIEECNIDLPRLENGKKRRYLYHVQLAS